MKEFNLEAAKQGKKVQTREGNEVRIICFDRKDAVRPIVALVMTPDTKAQIARYFEEVHYYSPNGKEDADMPHLDLVMATEKKDGWVNVVRYDGKPVQMDEEIYGTKNEAELHHGMNNELIATIKIEWEE